MKIVNCYRNVVKGKIQQCIIYIILIFSVFSDILRIPNTAFTFFRLFVPIGLIIIVSYPTYGKCFLSLVGGLMLMSLIQYFVFYRIERIDIPFTFSIFAKFFMLYVFAFAIFIFVKFLKDKEGEKFERKNFKFIIYTGLILMLIAIIDYFDSKYLDSCFFGALKADNQNNYGSYIAAVFPFFLVRFQEKRRLEDAAGIIASFVILFMNDSKAALFGVVMSLIIFLCIAFPADTLKKMIIYRYLVVIIAVVIIIGLVVINPTINGYSLQDTIYQPIIRVLKNNPYPDYGDSISYRTNTTLYCIRKFISIGGLGLGIGNTGVLLKYDFPDLNPEYEMARNSPFISLHNSWLEIALDLGIVMLVVYFVVIKYILKLYFTKCHFSDMEKIRIMFCISFPIWIMSVSGMYTMYYVMIVMAYLWFGEPKEKLIV